MFDDIPQKSPVPPANLPTEPVDMFAEVEGGNEPAPGTTGPSAVDAGMLKKRAPSVQMPPPISGGPQAYAIHEPVLGKVLMVILILAIAGGVGYGGWRLYTYLTATPAAGTPALGEITPEQPAITPLPSAPEEEATTTMPSEKTAAPTTSPEEAVVPEEQTAGEVIDTDKDGLTDAVEEQLGTDLNNSDTDKDGLSDGDEVLIWKTDPLKPDSDGDTYLDGEEVRNGYNPLGPGKLFNGQNAATTTVPATTTTSTVGEPAI